MQPLGIKSRQCRFAGIPNHEVQGGHSQFNFGFIGLATLTPVKLSSATYAHKWFKEYMAMANTAGVTKDTLIGSHVKPFDGETCRVYLDARAASSTACMALIFSFTSAML